MTRLKSINEFKKEFKSLEQSEMKNINGGLTKTWIVRTLNGQGCADQDTMAQDYIWYGGTWMKHGPQYRQSTCLEDSSCGY